MKTPSRQLDVVSTDQFQCTGVERAPVGTVRPVIYSSEHMKSENTVHVIATTFRDGMARVSCPNLQPENSYCAAGRFTAACPYHHIPLVEDIAGKDVRELGLSIRAGEALTLNSITRIGQLVERTPNDLLEMHNFGKVSLREVRNKLARKFKLKLMGDNE